MSDCEKKQCNDECNHDCHRHCNHHCKNNTIICPVCYGTGIKVPLETVKSLSKLEEINGEFYICSSRNCNVAYFSDTYLLEKEDLDVKIWFKEELKDFIVCYCHNISLSDVIDAVKQTNSTFKEDILKFLNKNLDNNDCLHKNPIGKDCDKLFINAIEYANKIK